MIIFPPLFFVCAHGSFFQGEPIRLEEVVLFQCESKSKSDVDHLFLSFLVDDVKQSIVNSSRSKTCGVKIKLRATFDTASDALKNFIKVISCWLQNAKCYISFHILSWYPFLNCIVSTQYIFYVIFRAMIAFDFNILKAAVYYRWNRMIKINKSSSARRVWHIRITDTMPRLCGLLK